MYPAFLNGRHLPYVPLHAVCIYPASELFSPGSVPSHSPMKDITNTMVSFQSNRNLTQIKEISDESNVLNSSGLIII